MTVICVQGNALQSQIQQQMESRHRRFQRKRDLKSTYRCCAFVAQHRANTYSMQVHRMCRLSHSFLLPARMALRLA